MSDAMTDQQYSSLRQNVSMLGRLLGNAMSDAAGPEFLEKVEQIRVLSKSARAGESADEATEGIAAQPGQG